MKSIKFLSILFLGLFFTIQSCVSKNEKFANEQAIDERQTVNAVQEVAQEIVQTPEENIPEGMSEAYQKLVRPIIEAFKNEDKVAISQLIAYPLKRYYPIPSIRNEAEFLERFDEVFDEELINKIINSDPATDWSDVGWRGIMLESGILWINYDGGIENLGMTDLEEEIREKIIATEKKTLHSSLRNFVSPKTIIVTDRFKIRIDEMERSEDGNYTCRYASWEIHQEMSEKPDLIINNGEMKVHGTIRSPEYIFSNGDYKYHCNIHIDGPDEVPPADLTIYKGEEKILYERADILELETYRTFYEALEK